MRSGKWVFCIWNSWIGFSLMHIRHWDGLSYQKCMCSGTPFKLSYQRLTWFPARCKWAVENSMFLIGSVDSAQELRRQPRSCVPSLCPGSAWLGQSCQLFDGVGTSLNLLSQNSRFLRSLYRGEWRWCWRGWNTWSLWYEEERTIRTHKMQTAGPAWVSPLAPALRRKVFLNNHWHWRIHCTLSKIIPFEVKKNSPKSSGAFLPVQPNFLLTCIDLSPRN